MARLILRLGILGFVVLLLLVQLLPYGHAHANPATRVEPQWDSAQTRQLAVRACFDCHSNDTTWPWYSNAAPVSWMIQHDVEDGRRSLNFSEWNRAQRETRGAARQVQRGEMPPFYYTILHPDASLAPDEEQALILGLQNTLGAAPGRPGGG